MCIRDSACAIAGAPAQVYCWGSSAGIAAGNLAMVTPISGTPVAIAAGATHVCAIVASGSDRTPYCWGNNTYGTLGRGTMGGSDGTPTAVDGSIVDAAELALGEAHSCVRRATGAVMCWGYNMDGRVGDGTTAVRNSPTAVSGLSDAVALAAGTAHTCAVRATDRVWCWGANSTGALGDGTTAGRSAPVQATVLGARSATAVACGGLHSCAVADGDVHCWGGNASGQLGRGDRLPASGLVSLGLSGIVTLSGARNAFDVANHTCGLRADGTAVCWGSGTLGRLASGVDLTVPTPLPVLLTY